MKAFNFLLLLSLLGLTTKAQMDEPVVARVNYDFIHVFDLNKPEKPVRQEMLLRLGKSSSKYTNFSTERGIKKIETPVSSSVQTVVAVGRPMAVVSNPGLPNGEIFQYVADKKLAETASLGIQNYRIETPLAAIDWKISDQKRMISNYNCQKATGRFGGRSWVAWFCAELPFQCGPWKLSGLPGLILEATDSTGEVQFLFKDISKDSTGEQITSSRLRLVPVSREAFNRAKNAFLDDPSASMQAQLKPGTPPPATAYIDETGKFTSGEAGAALIKKQKKELRLNPIELQ